jgi:hypothetical protein
MGVALLGALCLACIRLLSAAGVLAFKSTRRVPQRRLVARIEGELGGGALALPLASAPVREAIGAPGGPGEPPNPVGGRIVVEEDVRLVSEDGEHVIGITLRCASKPRWPNSIA